MHLWLCLAVRLGTCSYRQDLNLIFFGNYRALVNRKLKQLVANIVVFLEQNVEQEGKVDEEKIPISSDHGNVLIK